MCEIALEAQIFSSLHRPAGDSWRGRQLVGYNVESRHVSVSYALCERSDEYGLPSCDVGDGLLEVGCCTSVPRAAVSSRYTYSMWLLLCEGGDRAVSLALAWSPAEGSHERLVSMTGICSGVGRRQYILLLLDFYMLADEQGMIEREV